MENKANSQAGASLPTTEPKKLKIMYLITKSNFGGAGRYIFDLATHFNFKYEVLVVVGGNGLLVDRLKEKGIRVLVIEKLGRDVSFFKDFSVLKELISILKNEKPDIIHLNSSKIGGLGAVAGRITGIHKIIFTGHGWAFNEERSFFSKITIRLLHLVTILLCHKTIAVSEKTKKQIIEGVPLIKNKIVVVYNGISQIDFESREMTRKLFIEKFPQIAETIKNTHPLWIGTTSELHASKGLDFIIKAFGEIKKDIQNCPPFIFLIMGDGEKRKELEELITNENLSDRVFLLGYVNLNNDTRKYLKAFDIFSLTSRTEALPYTIIEAGEAGLATLASNVGGIAEIIEQMQSGILVKAGNIKEIREGLLLLMRDENKRKNFAEALQNKVRKEFSIEKMIEETEMIYIESKDNNR